MGRSSSIPHFLGNTNADTQKRIKKNSNMYHLGMRKEEELQCQRFGSKYIDHYWMCKMNIWDCNPSIENHLYMYCLGKQLHIAFLSS